MKILSIHSQTHDSSVALLEDGKVVYAVANERFSRKKMDGRVPGLALKNCLEYTKTRIYEIDEVVLVGDPFPFDFLKTFKNDALYTIFQLYFFLKYTRINNFFWWKKNLIFFENFTFFGIPRYFYKIMGGRIKLHFLLKGYKGQYTYVHHHLAHLYSAYYSSGWKECLVICMEGSGFIESTSIYKVKDNQWEKLNEVKLPHSIGQFYYLVTLLLGFNPERHAGKVTGLSSFGNSSKVYKYVKKLLRVEKGTFKFNYVSYFDWNIKYLLTRQLPQFFQGVRKEDIAAAFQRRLEECVTELIKTAIEKTGISYIAFAGGVAANVKLNKKIHEIKGVKEIYIHPAMDDSGVALGAALYVSHLNGFDVAKMQTIYFGSDFTTQEIEKTIKKYNVPFKKYQKIEKKIAQLLSEGKVIARFNGRMEYGPRALGNRSILYQGTDPSINDRLNKQLRRSDFMPFAPVTLEKFADKCYLNLEGAEFASRFMTITFDCTDYMKKQTPAAVHVDGTARPQIIRKVDNPSYYKILYEYHKITGIPSIVNTSFNMHEEPIVCTPDDALRAFIAGNMDYLAIGSYLVSVKFPV